MIPEALRIRLYALVRHDAVRHGRFQPARGHAHVFVVRKPIEERAFDAVTSMVATTTTVKKPRNDLPMPPEVKACTDSSAPERVIQDRKSTRLNSRHRT